MRPPGSQQITTMSNHLRPVTGTCENRPCRRIRASDRSTLPAMTEPHLSPAGPRTAEGGAGRTHHDAPAGALSRDRTRPRARRHQGERRLRRGQERAWPQRGPHPPARADAEERGRHRRKTARPTSSNRARSSSLRTPATTTSSRISSVRSKNATRSTTCCRRTRRSDMAILGKAPGATVTYQGPKREMSVTVVAVKSLG